MAANLIKIESNGLLQGSQQRFKMTQKETLLTEHCVVVKVKLYCNHGCNLHVFWICDRNVVRNYL